MNVENMTKKLKIDFCGGAQPAASEWDMILMKGEEV